MAVRDQSRLRRAQTELDPKVDLSPYLGEWVALRDGSVVASDTKVEKLRARVEVRESDVLMPVSPARNGYFVA